MQRMGMQSKGIMWSRVLSVGALMLMGASVTISATAAPTLASLRSHYETSVTIEPMAKMPLPMPPKRLFNTVRYDSDGVSLAAFVTPDPQDQKKHPAIVWITGGESNTLADFWRKGSKQNDQTASPYRDAGVIMMFPTLRCASRAVNSIACSSSPSSPISSKNSKPPSADLSSPSRLDAAPVNAPLT